MTKIVGQLPLAGVRVLVGRAQHQAGVLSENLRELGAEVQEIPFIEIRKPDSYAPLDAALKIIDRYDWLILTSVNGVEALWERLKTVALSVTDLKHLHVAAIGPATKKAIEARELTVEVVPEVYVAEAVVESLKGRIAGKKVLLARAKVARDVIPTELRKLGAEVDVVEAYETVVPQGSKQRLQEALEDEARRPDIITFTSSSTVRNFVALGEGSKSLAGVQFASIGPVTSATLRELGLPVDIEATQYTIPGLVEAIVHARLRHQDASSSR
jgi:uroporphyrinogen-III synthase